ncbi:DUF433 domain-containing protein [Haloactinopolyspora alba]|uniref:DUF433 domain-containing protein n=1 Tax=Haloactinopolyspora alba TaxID=648780 RepID=UPI000D0E168E|nr:DUF433 domain-containing protein [Haloactinopolyspora alba]
MAFERITVDHRIMGGVPCIRGTRVPVATVVGLIAEGLAPTDIVNDYPQLTVDDVRTALEYAPAVVDAREVPLLASA